MVCLNYPVATMPELRQVDPYKAHGWGSRNQQWIAQHADSYVTAPQIARKLGLASGGALPRKMPEPDLISPHRQKTRLWKREVVEQFFGITF
jgi:hypothetical protein